MAYVRDTSSGLTGFRRSKQAKGPPMSDEVIFVLNAHKSYVTWEGGFSGHPTELVITRYGRWSEVSLKGGGFTGEYERIIHSCPIDVLRRIVAMHDALPPLPTKGDQR